MSERTHKGLGNSQQEKSPSGAYRQNGDFYGKGTPFLCLLRKKQAANGYSFAVLAPYSKQGKDGKGMEKKRKIKDGQIVVKNPLYHELPTHEVTMQSGRTLYRFTGSYDGNRSLPHKVLRLMEQSPTEVSQLRRTNARYTQ